MAEVDNRDTLAASGKVRSTDDVLPQGSVARVVVHRRLRRIDIHLAPVFPPDSVHQLHARDGAETSENWQPADVPALAHAEVALARYRTLTAVAAEAFPAGTDVHLIAPAWETPVTKSQSSAIVRALVEYVAQTEMSANWLRHADRIISRGERPDQWLDEDGPGVIAVLLTVQNGTERQRLERRGVTGLLQAIARNAFGLEMEFTVDVDQRETERTEQFQDRLREQEQWHRQEVAALAQQAAERTSVKNLTADDSQMTAASPHQGRKRRGNDSPSQALTIGRPIVRQPVGLAEIVDEMKNVVVEGRIFHLEQRLLPSGRVLFQFHVTDDSDSIAAKLFTNNERQLMALSTLVDGVWLRLQGQVQFDTYNKEIVLMVQDMQPASAPLREDLAPDKRIELHMHTPMSALDGVTPLERLIKQAVAWGHQAIAVTDHGVVQAFPEAYALGQKLGIQVILGLEAYVVDDGTPIVYHVSQEFLGDPTEYVVFDTETTGLNAREDTLIEIAAVRVKNGRIVDTFTTLIDPQRPLSAKISEITGITAAMLENQPPLDQVLTQFREFAAGAVLVAHNAEFDVGFLAYCAVRVGLPTWTPPVIDTLALARTLYPGEKNYRLKTLTQKFAVELVHHHRALADAEATAKVFLHMLVALQARGVGTVAELAALAATADVSRVRPFHATLLVQNRVGLRNLYELVSLAHTQYLYRVPRIPKSILVQFREGLLLGTACQRGELVQGFLRGKSGEELDEIAKFYDYLELQPVSHYENLLREEKVQSYESIRNMHRDLLDVGRRLQIPVVATGDVHYASPADAVYRQIFLQSQPSADSNHQPPLHLRTTAEMMEEFRHLGSDAVDVVIHAPEQIASLCETVKPIPDQLHTPVIPGADDEIRQLAYAKARRLYGEPLPEVVAARLQRELHSIISHGFAVIYLIAHKLVTKSLADGYLVGSRGSVGSSLVATMTDITEVNPLAPHYRCRHCQFSEFYDNGEYGSGFDLPQRACPNCGEDLEKDGQDIPFETFLGFEGDKVPDIDLNFSGEYQPRAHKYTEELFGRDHVFRAGTISAVAEKTAYGYVRKFAEERGLVLRSAEVDRLVAGCTGVKRTSGQHPGGQVVVPDDVSIYDFTPVQYPADDRESGTLTTHFDYHSGLEACLLKLDILGHDDPTVIRMLQDLTGVHPSSIPLDDPQVLALFSGTDVLGVSAQELRSRTGTYAIPEFGTKFVRQMLEDTKPTTFSELVRISGLSHGTDVWLNNAQDLIRSGVATLSEVICARDDIMVYLIHRGLDPARAFKIMESIRKGRGVTDDDATYMRQFLVPDWYIESGRRIKYMFPKAHAVAYVIMAVRIAWFKVHFPLAFYATYFSVRADDFDMPLLMRGRPAIEARLVEIETKGNAAAPKEKSQLTVLEVALEMCLRGFRFLPVHLYESHASHFLLVGDDCLLPPFGAIAGVGATAASNMESARADGRFLSIQDLQERSHVSKTVIEILGDLGCLEGLPETNQLSLF